MTVYLDASVLLPSLVPEPGSARVDHFLDGLQTIPYVSEFAVAEVSSAISRLVRMRLLDEVQANLRLAAFDAWRAESAEPLDVAGVDVRQTSIIVRRFDLKLRAPDALHVAMCRRVGATLATMDKGLAAGGKAFGVHVLLL